MRSWIEELPSRGLIDKKRLLLNMNEAILV